MAKSASSPDRVKTLLRVLRYVRPHLPLVTLSLLLSVASSLLTLYIPVLAGRAIDCIAGEGLVRFDALSPFLFTIGLCAALAGVCQWIQNLANNRVTYSVVRTIRSDAFRHIQRLPLSYLDAHPSGDTVSRLVADADTFADGLLMGFTQLFTGITTILGTLFFMIRLSAPIALVVVVLTPLSLLMANFISSRTYKMTRIMSQVRGEETALIDEAISGQKLVQAFSREGSMLAAFDEVNGRLQACSLRAVFFSSLTNPCTRFVNSLVYAAVALTGAFAVVGGALTVGGLASFLSYANQYTKPFNEITGVITELQNALACAQRLFELIDEPEQTPDPADAAAPEALRGEVALRDVSFSYTPEQRLIEHFSLDVSPGQHVAIVGPTGCGKTTLINLLMRFYDADAGEIRMDGTETRQMTRSALRHSIGMVLQETWLASGTIRENIAMGRPEATDEEIRAAAKAAHADSFIRRLPEGYDTVISETGGQLSQGQKQLLCIARVMLCLPPMLILDEATSSIDTRTEMRIQQAFAKLTEGRTSFIVAHRLSTIRSADVILVMRDGHIVEQGSHEALLSKNGFYASLYRSQFAQ